MNELEWAFRRKAVHLGYWIFILICVIVFLVTNKFGSDSNFVQYISFASGLSGLLLAVVAIIYSIITHESSSDNLRELRGASKNIIEISALLKETAVDLAEQVSGIPSAMKHVTQSLGAIDNKLTTISNSPGNASAPLSAVSDVLIEEYLKNSSPSGIVALYVAKKSFVTGREATVSFEATKPYLNALYIYGYVASTISMGMMTANIVSDVNNLDTLRIKCISMNEKLAETIDLYYKNNIAHVQEILGSSTKAVEAFNQMTEYIEQI